MDDAFSAVEVGVSNVVETLVDDAFSAVEVGVSNGF